MILTLTARKPEAKDVESFIFEPAGPLVWRAGQYLHYVLHHRPTDDRGSDRWFTVSAAPSEGHVMVTTRFAGPPAGGGSSFKKGLTALKVGDIIEISEVEGDFVIADPSAEYVFIAGGIGITPFRAILMEASHAGVMPKVTLLYGNRDTDVPFKAELDAIAAGSSNLTIHYLTAPQVIDEAAIRALVSDLSAPLFYVSGPAPMVFALSDVLKGMGVAEERIKLDDFPGYPAE